MPKSTVYRIQFEGADVRYSNQDLRGGILDHLDSTESEAILEHVCLFPSCYSPSDEIVGLVKFNETPHFLARLKAGLSRHQTILLRGNVTARFDLDFTGFTPLNHPDDAQGISADIIAICGIGGHAYGSWTSTDNGADFMWIQDALSKKFPRSRIMIYGYESKLDSRSTNRLSDYCRGLIEQLGNVRQTEEELLRPIIFIAHSYGGIIAANAHSGFDRTLYNAVEGFFFFGTPHKGIIIDEIREMLNDPSHPRHDLLAEIESANKFLGDQLHTFKNVLRKRSVVSFYETQQTKSLVKSDDGRWTRSGPYIELSSREGSLLGLSDEDERKVAVNEDHSKMVKFDSGGNMTYRSLVRYLADILPASQGNVLQRNGRTDPNFRPRELLQWLSQVDFREWEMKHLKLSDIVDLGSTFFQTEEFRAWETHQIRRLECYGAAGYGKTYLAYLAAERLENSGQNSCVVRLYGNSKFTTDTLLGAMLNQLIYRKQTLVQTYVIPWKIQFYYYKTSTAKRPPQTHTLVGFLENAIINYEYVYVIVDGFSEMLQEVQSHLLTLMNHLENVQPSRIGFLFFKREDGYIPRQVPYCDGCNKVALVHYRCTHVECDDSPWFDLCPSCYGSEDGKYHDASHKMYLKLDPRVVTLLPTRVKEMRYFIECEVDKMIQPLRSLEMEQEISKRDIKPYPLLAELCHADPSFKKELAESIAVKLWGMNFRVAREWLDTLKKQPTAQEVRARLSSFPWRTNSGFQNDIRRLKSDRDTDDQKGWKIVSLILASQTMSISQKDFPTAIAFLPIPIEFDRHNKIIEKKDIENINASRMIQYTKGLISIIQDEAGDIQPDRFFLSYFRRSEITKQSVNDAHHIMALTCLKFLTQKLPELHHNDMYQRNRVLWDEPFLSYATKFWGDHVRLASPTKRSEVRSRATKFLENPKLIEAYIKIAWVSNLQQETSFQWDVNQGIHALHICAWKGHEGAVHELLRLRADPALFSNRGYNALFEAVMLLEDSTNHLEEKLRITEILFRDDRVHINATHPNSHGRTALHLAVLKGHVAIVQKLLDHGADPNLVDDRGFTSLMCAARDGKVETVKVLLEKGALSDITGSNWRFRTTALHLAIERYPQSFDAEGKLAYRHIIEDLLAHQANPEWQDIWGVTAIAKAERRGLEEIVSLLSDKEQGGLQGTRRTSLEMINQPIRSRPLHLAVDTLQVHLVIDLVRSHPSLARTKDQYGQTPLHLAANKWSQHSMLVENAQALQDIIAMIALLIPVSNVSARDYWGLEPLDYAIYNRKAGPLIELLEGGAECGVQRWDADDLCLLLARAFDYHKPRAIRALLRLGADELQTYSLINQTLSLTDSLYDLRRYKQGVEYIERASSKRKLGRLLHSVVSVKYCLTQR
ncbi:hypothetical protein N0V90_012916 [Kalmusia sp. IMI 367209]|nr:hypothetical protein N0V90_012916 [Kalmusia sp. IMI 367209]